MENPKVEVVEISLDPVQNRIVDLEGAPMRVNLGDTVANRNVNRLLAAHRERPSKSYLLRWNDGSRVPRGVVLNGHTIGWTQHGVVSDANGKMIGVYDRLTDTIEQVMLVQIFIESAGRK